VAVDGTTPPTAPYCHYFDWLGDAAVVCEEEMMAIATICGVNSGKVHGQQVECN
jgi:hypothetical protein